MIRGNISIISRKNSNKSLKNNEYNKLVYDIENKISKNNINIICDNNETISTDVQYTIADLITDICHLMYSIDYNNQPHHYTNMSNYLTNCIEFVENIIQQISLFETSLNEKANMDVAKENFIIQCFNIMGICDEKFKEVNIDDPNIEKFNSKLYEMIIKIFNYEYKLNDFNSIETNFTTYSNVRLTWEIIHKKLLILENEKKREYSIRNKKLIENSTFFGFIENWFFPENTNTLQITNGESIMSDLYSTNNPLITY